MQHPASSGVLSFGAFSLSCLPIQYNAHAHRRFLKGIGMSSRFILPSAIACLLAACASSPKPATAVTAPVDPATQRWQTYERMEGAYYLLDKQDFSQLSCHIDVPVADKFVQQLRVSMAHVADKIDFTDTLSSYRLTYSKLTGLHIEDPTIDVQVKPGVQIPDPAKVEK